MIRKGASGKDAELAINLFDAMTGAPIVGHVWIAGELLLVLPNGVFANATVANIVEKGRGRYALRLTALESAVTGMVQIDLDTTNGYLPHSLVDQILDLPTAASVLAELRAWGHDTGATFEGLMVRLDAFIAGRGENMNGPHATWYKRGGGSGVGIAFEGDVDPVIGMRAESDISGSE